MVSTHTKNLEVFSFLNEPSTSLYGNFKVISNATLTTLMGVLSRRNITPTQILEFGYDLANSKYFVVLK